MHRLQILAFAVLLVLAFGVGTIYASGGGKVIENPDIGRTRAETEAAQLENSKEFWARLPIWTAEHAKTVVDPEKLPRFAMIASIADPLPTLNESIKAATLIVDGTVESLQFQGSGGTVGTVRVNRTVKGPETNTLEVLWPGGLRPNPGWDDVSIAYLEEAPIVFPGGRVVLFLEPSATNKGQYEVQVSTGTYFVENELLRPLEANPFATSLGQMSVDGLSNAAANLTGAQ